MQPMIPKYICLDGGGSKLECQVLDANGKKIFLMGQEDCFSVSIPGANINFDGHEKVEQMLATIFKTTICQNEPLQFWLKGCKVVAGMAGVARLEPREKVAAIFAKVGVLSDSLELLGDVEMTLKSSHNPNGIAVVCGTGHVIFGKIDGQMHDKKGNFYRLGGWGLLDDKASGYTISVEAIKAVRSYEYENGPETKLTDLFCKAFEGRPVLDVLKDIGDKKLTTKSVAAFCQQVHLAALKGDKVAKAIMNDCFINELPRALIQFVTNQKIISGEIQFTGGLMKGEYAQMAIENTANALKPYGEFTFVNKCQSHVGVDYALAHYFRPQIIV